MDPLNSTIILRSFYISKPACLEGEDQKRRTRTGRPRPAIGQYESIYETVFPALPHAGS